MKLVPAKTKSCLAVKMLCSLSLDIWTHAPVRKSNIVMIPLKTMKTYLNNVMFPLCLTRLDSWWGRSEITWLHVYQNIVSWRVLQYTILNVVYTKPKG